MISDDERFRVFMEAAGCIPGGVPEEIRKTAAADHVPVIRRSTQDLLRVILAAKKPETVLEVGTAVGFSAVFICSCSGASVVTIENNGERIRTARKNFEKAGMSDRIRLIEGDAEQVIPGLKGPFDLIFLDAAKGQYIAYLPDVLRLLAPGGILLADNVLQEGEILDSRYAVDRRNRTIHRRIREFIRAVSVHPDLETAVLPLGDGLSVSVKKTGNRPV